MLAAAASLLALSSLAAAHSHQDGYARAIHARQDASTTRPYSELNSLMATSTVAFSTPTAGAQPSLAGAPPLPAFTQPSAANYPAADVIPPTDSEQVKAWVAAIDWTKVPNYAPNVAATTGSLCEANPAALADKSRCWWSCGQCVTDTDITVCPDKETWGTSFDDGPSESSTVLLDYLTKHDLKTTFYIIGSRAYYQPHILRHEHMLGHELAGHTWSHFPLTTLTNEQIVAELGWTRQLIKDLTGVTILTFRPPQGDVDSRVRAIASQMQMQAVMWSSVSGELGNLFDTQDWNVYGGRITAERAVSEWNTFLDTNLPKMTTGFVSLEHDLYPVTVALATEHFLPGALNRTTPSKLRLTSIIECQGKGMGEAYLETAKNLVFSNSSSSTGGSSSNSSAGSSGASASASATRSGPIQPSSSSAAVASAAAAGNGGTSAAPLTAPVWTSFALVGGALVAGAAALAL